MTPEQARSAARAVYVEDGQIGAVAFATRILEASSKHGAGADDNDIAELLFAIHRGIGRRRIDEKRLDELLSKYHG